MVAAGKGDLTTIVEPDPARTAFAAPQRALSIAYVRGLGPDPEFTAPHVSFDAVPGVGGLFVIPALTLDGLCDILFWEALPGGPADLWTAREPMEPARHLPLMLDLAGTYVPWAASRAGSVRLAGARPTLQGRFTPVVREPVAVVDGARRDGVDERDAAAAANAQVATRFADGFSDPSDFDHWFMTPSAVDR
ncbi:styrene monooxygenase/indole monooxygenase family protein [Actinoplanes sp. NPDC051494]|uniref:styrene monooxygenase/indole monooxygenase family protein n=1 Tax=Actinoplanes sp. NPDC051494 TaxID=3363907 RepID=UPI003798A010